MFAEDIDAVRLVKAIEYVDSVSERVPQGVYSVGRYIVRADDDGYRCQCADFNFRKKNCKHIYALILARS